MAVGKTYDESEVSRISELMNEQQTQMNLIDKEKEFANKNILRYTIMFSGGVVLLVVLKLLISKKKKK